LLGSRLGRFIPGKKASTYSTGAVWAPQPFWGRQKTLALTGIGKYLKHLSNQ
jgi:hypothetical protein